MYHPLRYPQILYTLVFVFQVAGFAFVFHESSIHLEEFIDILPTLSQLIGSALKTFRVCVHLTCICIVMLAYDFFKYTKNELSKLPYSTLTSLFKYYKIANAYLSVLGLLGFVTYPDLDISAFQLGMEILYFYGALNFLISYDIMLRWMKKKVFIGVWIYDSLMTVTILSFYALRILTMVLDVEEAISLCSITEYLAHFLIALKFPICGWELQNVLVPVEKDKKE
ncbi:hypothetical protein TRFO_04020 [Tritrichomonas foetus]|uniref:Uncharacterized protein n=1 Tax=Tritrichomonas foetus TaxID=1144522 RepID=A0A1J4KIM7_9EUKA|nr:hypothetical protein TRFO_04020 [Tritrichomonas foetus]|eukprot:OHT11083.1 hypothetical protein TRFO_04020 [Tritrichomonas foetus]